MMEFTYLLAFCLACFGAANGIAISHLTSPLRAYFSSVDRPKTLWIGNLLKCPMCLGFWFGGLFGLLGESPTGFVVSDMFLGSAASWLIYIYVYKQQFSYSSSCSSCAGSRTQRQDPEEANTPEHSS